MSTMNVTYQGGNLNGAPARFRALIGALAWLVTLPSGAALVPGIQSTFPSNVGASNGQNASFLRTTINGSVFVSYPDADSTSPIGLNDGYSKSDSSVQANTVTLEDQAFVSANGYSARAESTAASSAGVLRASTKVQMARPDLFGFGFASASVRVDYLDVLVVGDEGGLQDDPGVDFNVQLAVSGVIREGHPLVRGEATAFAQAWLFPYVPSAPLPVPFAPIDAKYYASFFTNTDSPAQTVQVGTFDRLQPGSAFWIYSVLQIEAGTGFRTFPNFPVPNTSTSAEFQNTVQLFIDPSATTPHASYTTFSGASYRSPVPVPLPATVALLGLSLIGLLRTKKREN